MSESIDARIAANLSLKAHGRGAAGAAGPHGEEADEGLHECMMTMHTTLPLSAYSREC